MNGATVATEHERTDELAGVTSAIWQGSVRHRRFAPRAHAFSYSLFMLGLDLDELPQLDSGALVRCGALGAALVSPL